MAKIVITSGPTRQYLDPVRYLTNASSGRMGSALAAAALEKGHQVTIVSGPVQVDYPKDVVIIPVVSTDDMLQATRAAFEDADGLIGAAAPCDYMPKHVQAEKMSKTGREVMLQLVETPDIVATLGASTRYDQWVVGFALETEDRRFRAIAKMQRKCCDLMISNGPSAIDSDNNEVEVLDPSGIVLATIVDTKEKVAVGIFDIIHARLLPTSGSRNQ
jgi:phosphopantothenoylcysteine decarboxylase / phosphopantothenate---cysteine ligase